MRRPYVDAGEQSLGVRPRKARTGVVAPSGPSLFDAPAPSVPRVTSEDAADAQPVHKRDADRLRILKCLAVTPEGLTRDQLADRLGISPNTVRPRIVELVTLGCVHDDRITRLTVTGSPAAVCEITEEGLAYLNQVCGTDEDAPLPPTFEQGNGYMPRRAVSLVEDEHWERLAAHELRERKQFHGRKHHEDAP